MNGPTEGARPAAPPVILCIDDDPTVLESLDMELRAAFPGFQIELFDRPADAIAQAAALGEGAEVPVIICDYIMPGMRGDEVLIALHRQLPQARTIMLTGQSSLDGVTNAINRAALFRFLSKPWSSQDLYLTVESALGSYRQERTIERQNAELKVLNQGLERKVAERTAELEAARNKLREQLALIDEHVIISRTDAQGRITSVSNAFCRVFGYSRHDLLGRPLRELIDTEIPDQQVDQIWAAVGSGYTWRGELKYRRHDGTSFWTYDVITPNSGGDEALGFTAVRHDISDRKRVEQLSITDELTGLYNRRYLHAVIGREAAHALRQGKQLGMLVADADNFKRYNDTYGHQAGDDVLRRIGAVLKIHTFPDRFIPFRLGGEEFGVLAAVSSPQELAALGERLVAAVAEQQIPHAGNAPHAVVTLSVGGALPPGQPFNLDAVYLLADRALYRAKSGGRNRTVFEGLQSVAEA
jgi:diguanylate cyclase (GGDEF)-like protein/PAS domain S-box-containing protein